MNCPKCSEEMQFGEIAYTNGKGGLFWAPQNFFKEKIINYPTKNGALKAGGLNIPLGGGLIHDRTKGYACRKCNLVLIDCN